MKKTKLRDTKWLNMIFHGLFNFRWLFWELNQDTLCRTFLRSLPTHLCIAYPVDLGSKLWVAGDNL